MSSENYSQTFSTAPKDKVNGVDPDDVPQNEASH